MDAQQLTLFNVEPYRVRVQGCAVCGGAHLDHDAWMAGWVEPVWPAPEPAEQLDLLDLVAA